MKRNVLRSLMKKTLAGALTLGLVLSAVCVAPTTASEVQAAEATVYSEEFAVEANWGKVPKPTNPPTTTYADWVFAGWYTDEGCTQVVAEKPEEGNLWAKFVPAELMSVRCQILAETDENDESSNMRLISTVDTLNYKNVGFDIEVGEKTITCKTSTVLRKIDVTDVDGGVAFGYDPEDLCDAAEFFATVTLTNIKDFETGMLITPYWETMDGTKVTGDSRYARVEDGYLNIVNVPVQIHGGADVAAGLVQVNYANDKFTFVGMDYGTVFTELDGEMEYANTGSAIRCIGNVEDIRTNAEAEGMFVNLRFQMNGTLTENVTFEVINEDFCNNAEDYVKIDAANVVYKVLTPDTQE